VVGVVAAAADVLCTDKVRGPRCAACLFIFLPSLLVERAVCVICIAISNLTRHAGREGQVQWICTVLSVLLHAGGWALPMAVAYVVGAGLAVGRQVLAKK